SLPANCGEGALTPELVVLLRRRSAAQDLAQNIDHGGMIEQLLRWAGERAAARLQVVADGVALALGQDARQEHPPAQIKEVLLFVCHASPFRTRIGTEFTGGR